MSVSILIPAFRPTFLRQAIASALTQGLDDFELIISDDSGGDDVRAVVEQFRDPRIRYVTTPGRIGAADNCRALWGLASHDLMIFLFDDDLLMPHALADLTAQAEAHPEAAFYLGRRYFVDDSGRTTEEPPPASGVAKVDGPKIVQAIVGTLVNSIGELSNTLMNRRVGLIVDDLSLYMGFDLHFMTDVAFFINASRKGPAVQIARPLSAFRRHAAQNSSSAFNPRLAIGIGEWELFIRGEFGCGRLAGPQALAAIGKLGKAYETWSRTLPDISLLAPGLGTLRERVEAAETDLLDAAFKSQWDTFVAAVEAGVARIRPA